MKTIKLIFGLSIILMLNACISDDFVEDEVDPILELSTRLDTIAIGDMVQLEYQYFNNIGASEEIEVSWMSSDESVLSVSESGWVSALEFGTALVTIEATIEDQVLTDFIEVAVGNTTSIEEPPSVIEGTIMTTSSYQLTGDFTYAETDTGVELEFKDNYKASTALPGLYVYLSNNANSIANALEIGRVETFNGAHSYQIEDVKLSDYQFLVYFCKPFNIKVGDGQF